MYRYTTGRFGEKFEEDLRKDLRKIWGRCEEDLRKS